MVRSRGDLVEMRVAAINQLSALLEAHWPGARAMFADVESPIRAAPAGTSRESLTEALRDAVLAAVGVLAALNAAVKNLDRSVAAHLGEHRTARSSRRCQGRATPTGCSPSGATAAKPATGPTPSPPSPGSPPSPANPASTAPSISAGPATSASASR